MPQARVQVGGDVQMSDNNQVESSNRSNKEALANAAARHDAEQARRRKWDLEQSYKRGVEDAELNYREMRLCQKEYQLRMSREKARNAEMSRRRRWDEEEERKRRGYKPCDCDVWPRGQSPGRRIDRDQYNRRRRSTSPVEPVRGRSERQPFRVIEYSQIRRYRSRSPSPERYTRQSSRFRRDSVERGRRRVSRDAFNGYDERTSGSRGTYRARSETRERSLDRDERRRERRDVEVYRPRPTRELAAVTTRNIDRTRPNQQSAPLENINRQRATLAENGAGSTILTPEVQQMQNSETRAATRNHGMNNAVEPENVTIKVTDFKNYLETKLGVKVVWDVNQKTWVLDSKKEKADAVDDILAGLGVKLASLQIEAAGNLQGSNAGTSRNGSEMVS
ncbi:hypothetical protein RUND412_007147 [Rhizina undulata]